MIAYVLVDFGEIPVKRFVAALMLAGGLLVAGVANAAATMTFNQVGSNVEASITGSINLAGLGGRSATQYRAVVQGNIAQAGVGTDVNLVDAFAYTSNISGPTSLGSGASAIVASSGAGGPFTLIGAPSFGPKTLYVPRTYTSGSTISGVTSTWNNRTIATLRLTPGTYVYTLGTGGNTDTLTIQINSPPAAQAPAPQPIPTLSEWTLILLGLIVMATLGWYWNRERSY